jgi:hydrogenase maturation protease
MTGKKIVILGIGNLLFGDDGVGVHTVRALEKMALPPGTELVDGGTSPELIQYLDTAGKLVVIDAMDTGDKPGSIYRFRLDELKTEPQGMASAHNIGLMSLINLARLTGRHIPETVFIGVQPASMDWGLELSADIAARLPIVTRLVMDEVKAGLPADESIAVEAE